MPQVESDDGAIFRIAPAPAVDDIIHNTDPNLTFGFDALFTLIQAPNAPAPEPASMAMLGIGLAGLGVSPRHRKTG